MASKANESKANESKANESKATEEDKPVRKDYRDVGVTESRPVDFREVGFGFEQHSLAERRILYAAVFVLAGLLLWTHSTRIFLSLEAARSALVGRYEMLSATINSLEGDLIMLIASLTFLILFAIGYLMKTTNVYLVDFTVLHPDQKYTISHENFMFITRRTKYFTKESEDFQEKISKRSGLGDRTYFPAAILEEPPRLNMKSAREEADYVMGTCLEELFAKTNTKPTDIDILIVNCSLFNPTPSLAAMIINKYKFRDNVRNYNLAGMGCSAGVISLDLAKDLLRVHPNSLAVVISTENITQNWYRSNERDMLVSNCLFRMGGAAILLSNRSSDSWRSKYRLLQTVRVHKASDDVAYNSVFQEEDSTGQVGVRLSKDLVKVAGDALKTNLTMLGPLILPFSEQALFLVNYAQRKFLGRRDVKPYTPNFKKAVQHYCIHAGGRAVIDGLEQNLKLEPKHVLPSRATLNRMGNTSSSSIWYELSFSETHDVIKRGDRVWQIAFGSGFKCNSAIWVAQRNIKDSTRLELWNGVEGLQEEYEVVLKQLRARLTTRS